MCTAPFRTCRKSMCPVMARSTTRPPGVSSIRCSRSSASISLSVNQIGTSIATVDDIRRYIARDNPDAAWVVASFIRRSIKSLEDWSYSGRTAEKKDVRRLVVANYPYVVYYRVSDEVQILSVRHAARER